MHFISSGRTKISFELLYQKIAKDGDSLSFYENCMVLLRDLPSSFVADSGSDSQALLLLDHALYKGFSDFIFDFLRLKNIRIPIVLIEPSPFSRDKLPLRWISENEFQYDFPNLHGLYPILQKINDALKDKEIQHAFEDNVFVKKIEKNRSLKKNPIENIKNHANFSPSFYNLLHFFFLRHIF